MHAGLDDILLAQLFTSMGPRQNQRKHAPEKMPVVADANSTATASDTWIVDELLSPVALLVLKKKDRLCIAGAL